MITKEEILEAITLDKASERKAFAKKGADYYNGKHDIFNYKMYYYDSDGELVEDTTRSNIKIAHPFFTELVDQCVNYLLSGDNQIVKSDLPELQEELDEYFDEDFINELSDTLTDTKSKGFGYMYAYKTKNDRLKFVNADAMGVVEVRAKDTSDKCDYVIYWYVDRVEMGKREIKRVLVMDDKYTYYYVQTDNGDLIEDEDQELNPRPNVIYRKGNDDQLYYNALGFIPFFRLDNNKRQISDLKSVKALIDDYDLMNCGLSNNLDDFDHPIYAVSGFQGDDLDGLIKNLKTKKTIGVDTGGNVDIKTINIPYQARMAKLELDEKNIYKFGMGFNSNQLGDGNVTNVVIKSRYALLDLKCDKLMKPLKAFLRKLIGVVLQEINNREGTDYKQKDVYFDFDREVITNAQDNANIKLLETQVKEKEIGILLGLVGKIDNETIIKSICEQLDISYEDIKDKLPVSAEQQITEMDNLLNE